MAFDIHTKRCRLERIAHYVAVLVENHFTVSLDLVALRELNLDPAQVFSGVPVGLRHDSTVEWREAKILITAF